MKEKKSWTGKSRGGNFGNFFMKQVTVYFGPKTAYFFLYFICPYFYLFAPKAVLSHNQYFKTLYPEMGFFKRQFLIVKTFYKLGQVLIDNIYSSAGNSNLFTLKREGRQYLPLALQEEKGLILVGAHVGGWMFEAKLFDSHKEGSESNIKINVVEFNAGMGNSSQDKIQNSNVNFIQNTDQTAIFKINQAIEQNEVVVFMGDRVLNHNFELVLFLGKLAIVDTTPFKIALAKKAPIVFTFGFKSPRQVYDMYLTSPLVMENLAQKGKDAALMELTTKYTETLEHYLKQYPTQWFNFFPFWSTLPPQEVVNNPKKATLHSHIQ